MYSSWRCSASHHGRLSSSRRGSGLEYFFRSDFSSAIFQVLLFACGLLVAENQRRSRMARAERPAGAVAQGRRAIPDLARTAFAAQLLDRLDHQEDAAHARMVRREAAAVGVDRQIAVVAQPPAADESAALAAPAEAEILERH